MLAEPGALIEVQTRQTVLTTALVAVRLTHPIADRRGGALELASQLSRRAARADQLHHLASVLRRVRRLFLRHVDTSSAQCPGVHQSGATPRRAASGSPSNRCRPASCAVGGGECLAAPHRTSAADPAPRAVDFARSRNGIRGGTDYRTSNSISYSERQLSSRSVSPGTGSTQSPYW